MRRLTLFSRYLLGTAMMLGLAAAPSGSVHAAQPDLAHSQARDDPFTGTATLTFTPFDQLVPAQARVELVRSEQTTTFAVRDATHWRVNVHTTAPIIDSGDVTVVSDGQQIVAYSTLSNQAFRLPGGVTESEALLSVFLNSQSAPTGVTTAQFIARVKANPREKARVLGQEQVVGRTADVVQISPLAWVSTGSCTGPKDCAKKQKGYGSGKIWLDREHGVVLRYDQQGLSKVMGAAHGYRYLVTSIAFGQGPSDTDLSYVPPVAIADLPQNGNTQSGGSSGGGGRFMAPPGFITVGNPFTPATVQSLQGMGSGADWLSGGTSYAEGEFRGGSKDGFVFVKERTRALGLPAELTAGSAQVAGVCQVWTGTFPGGLNWLAMMRKHIAILVVANKLTQADLVRYAASGICTAPFVPQPSASAIEHTALDQLETEIDITRQILGWSIAAAPSAADKSVLKGFDRHLEAFDRTVFTIRHRGDPQAVYGPPGFPPPQRHPFKDTVSALKGEMGAAQHMLTAAEAAVRSPTDRQTLQKQGVVFDDLIRAADGMVHA